MDTTVANVALRYIAGGLSAAVIDSEWVITSYLAANAFVLPITGWLSAHFGRRNYFLLVDRRLHPRLGALRHGRQPAATDPVPRAPGPGRRRTPALQPGGPAGQLPARETRRGHDDVRRRRPARADRRPDAGRLARRYLQLALDLLHQPPRGRCSASWPATPCWTTRPTSKQRRAELKKRPLNFDGIGLGLLALVMASWEVVLSKGQEWDWLGDPFWRVQTLLIVFLLGWVGLLYRELRFASPVVNFRVLRERNFAVSLRHYLLRVRRAVRGDRGPAGTAPDVVRLRCLSLGPGACRRPVSSRS